tara:strand:- start:564 stop:1184 length:621 start_codon:yes stop_codon:yes gene_type:complete
MHLFLDVISPIPEFSVFNENKIILSRKIIQSEEEKLSDSIIPRFLEIEKNLNLLKNLDSIIVTTGPGSYTSLRVGISFVSGLHFSKNIKIAGISSQDLLSFKLEETSNYNSAFYIISANKQEFFCGKLFNKDFSYIKLEKNSLDNNIFKKIDLLYYNFRKISIPELEIKQQKYLIKENILKNLNKIKYNNTNVLKPIYISNNKILN